MQQRSSANAATDKNELSITSVRDFTVSEQSSAFLLIRTTKARAGRASGSCAKGAAMPNSIAEVVFQQFLSAKTLGVSCASQRI